MQNRLQYSLIRKIKNYPKIESHFRNVGALGAF